MKINEAGRNIIIEFETMQLVAYPDPGTGGAPWTIGFGHTGPEVVPGLSWGVEECWEALERDIEAAEMIVDDLVETCLNENQYSALVSFVFNIGREQFKNSTMLKKLNEVDLAAAGEEFPRWVHAAGHVLHGLEIRRECEQALFLKPA